MRCVGWGHEHTYPTAAHRGQFEPHGKISATGRIASTIFSILRFLSYERRVLDGVTRPSQVRGRHAVPLAAPAHFPMNFGGMMLMEQNDPQWRELNQVKERAFLYDDPNAFLAGVAAATAVMERFPPQAALPPTPAEHPLLAMRPDSAAS